MSAVTDPSWQQVALQALNVAQTVLLTYLTVSVRQNRSRLEHIATRSDRVRSSDNGGRTIQHRDEDTVA